MISLEMGTVSGAGATDSLSIFTFSGAAEGSDSLVV